MHSMKRIFSISIHATSCNVILFLQQNLEHIKYKQCHHIFRISWLHLSLVFCVFWRGLLKSFPYVCARFATRLFIIYNCHKISVSTARESHLPPHNIALWFRQKCFFQHSWVVNLWSCTKRNISHYSTADGWKVSSKYLLLILFIQLPFNVCY